MPGMICATALPEVLRSFLDDTVRWGFLCTCEGALMAYASGENATATSASGKRAGVPYVEKSDAKVAAAWLQTCGLTTQRA